VMNAGLCYQNIPEGFSRQVWGLLSQTCPSGWGDGGVFCQRPSKTRGPPQVGVNFRIRSRRTNPVEPAPKLCDQLGLDDPATVTACQQMLCLPDESIAEGTSDFCVTRCANSYQPAAGGMCVRAGGDTDPLSGTPFSASSYQRRNPLKINWEDENPTTTPSTWAEFAAAAAVDVPSNELASGADVSLPPITPPGNAILDSIQPFSGIQFIKGGMGCGLLPDSVPVTHVATSGENTIWLAFDGALTRMLSSTGEGRIASGDATATWGSNSWSSFQPASCTLSQSNTADPPAPPPPPPTPDYVPPPPGINWNLDGPNSIWAGPRF